MSNQRNAVIPSVRYQRAPEMMNWLCRMFGFEKRAVFEGKDGEIHHAQLTLESGMLMLGSITESEFSKNMVQPSETGGRETVALYLVMDDVKACYERVKAAGAEIVMELREESYGGEAFSCRDPEGHIWSVGGYDPWKV